MCDIKKALTEKSLPLSDNIHVPYKMMPPELLHTINKENRFQGVVLGHTECVNVWIHYFIGDTEGNNKWLGQYPGNREGMRRPYRDCKCQFHDLSNPNPNCIYLTMDNFNLARKRKRDNEDAGIE
jgi:hypothetical protein